MIEREVYMLNEITTHRILEDHFCDCLKFWLRMGKNDREAYLLAMRDIKETNHDPNEPMGQLLHVETKEQFIEYLVIVMEVVL
jgi:hypothetical protein